MAVGAILTQNTNWKNVERAIGNLKKEGVLSPERLLAIPADDLSDLLRPSGFFRIKTRRLKNYVMHMDKHYRGDFRASLSGDMETKRAELLSISGIGPETADSILLYAGGHATFVVDAYTKRVMARHYLCDEDTGYDELRSLFTANLPADASLFNEFHALFVAVGKTYCRPKEPRCGGCPLSALLVNGR
jgi:endonuclease-3 related protein